MGKRIGMVVLAVAITAALIASTVLYKVDETSDIIVVKEFGAIKAVKSGTADAGLHFKWPWPIQTTVRYDKRWQQFETPQTETWTADKRNVLVTVFCTWRIDPATELAKKFHTSLQTMSEGETRLQGLLAAAFREVIQAHNLAEFVNPDPAQVHTRQIEDEMLARVNQHAAEQGMDVQRVGLKVLSLTEQVSAAAIKVQIAERKKEADRYRADGEAEASRIRAIGKAYSDIILDFSRRKASDIRTEADAVITQEYRLMRPSEELAMYLRSLESLKKQLSGKTNIILDGSMLPAIDFLQTGPNLQRFSTSQPAGVAVAPSGK